MAIVEAAKQIRTELCARAAKLWDMKPAEVEYSGGQVRPIAASDKVKAMSVAEL